jgi:hypothetical protein
VAKLYITEFQNMAAVGSRFVNVPAMPPVAEQTVAIGAGSVQSNPFNAATAIIRVEADSVCSIEIGPTASGGPVATANTMRIPASAPGEYFAVQPGQVLAVITNS